MDPKGDNTLQNSLNVSAPPQMRCTLNKRWSLIKRRLNPAPYTGLFKMTVGVKQSSGYSAPNSGNNHHLAIPFEGGMHSFNRQGACVCRNWRYESEPPLKPSPLTCYKQFGTNSIIVLMFVESQRLHIQSTCKVRNKNLECCSINLLTPELFFFNFSAPVYKMWIMQETNTLELWNKLHF